MMRISAGLVRIPDVSLILWDRIPGRRLPREPTPSLAPDLAAEVLISPAAISGAAIAIADLLPPAE